MPLMVRAVWIVKGEQKERSVAHLFGVKSGVRPIELNGNYSPVMVC